MQAVGLFILCFAVYFVICCVLPPLRRHRAAAVQESDLHGNESGKDTHEHIRCIGDNHDALLVRFRLIQSAQREIIFSTYSYGMDHSGTDILACLYQAAKRGVRVRLLADGLCSYLSVRFSFRFGAIAALPNVEIKLYNPLSILRPWKINYRMHDKYLLVDGCAYLLGGRNTNDIFLGNYRKKQNIDRDVLVLSGDRENSSAGQLKAYFEKIWSLDDCRKIKACSVKKYRRQIYAMLDARYARLKEQYPSAFDGAALQDRTFPVRQISLLSNPVNAGNKIPKLWAALKAHMAKGKKVLLQTPYIICNQYMYRALAAVAKTAESFIILTNSIKSGANPWGCADYANEKHRIRKIGAAVYEYIGKRSVHAKALLIDEDRCVFGTFNLDMRSVYLDTELMLSIQSKELNRAIRTEMSEMVSQSICVPPAGHETAGHNCKESRMSAAKRIGHALLRNLIWPFRHLL